MQDALKMTQIIKLNSTAITDSNTVINYRQPDNKPIENSDFQEKLAAIYNKANDNPVSNDNKSEENVDLKTDKQNQSTDKDSKIEVNENDSKAALEQLLNIASPYLGSFEMSKSPDEIKNPKESLKVFLNTKHNFKNNGNAFQNANETATEEGNDSKLIAKNGKTKEPILNLESKEPDKILVEVEKKLNVPNAKESKDSKEQINSNIISPKIQINEKSELKSDSKID